MLRRGRRTPCGSTEEARLAALEERIDADLACGRQAELVGELEGLTQVHPLREHLWYLRTLALYRAGRQAEALAAYQELRHLLDDELGIAPSERLNRLQTAILRQDPGLALRPVEPTAPATRAQGWASWKKHPSRWLHHRSLMDHEDLIELA